MKMKKETEGVASRRLKRRGTKKGWRSILEGVSRNSPSLSQAYHLTQKASRVGFDWPNIEGVLGKFMSRFHYIETCLHTQGKSFSQSNLIEMDRLWEESKKKRR